MKSIMPDLDERSKTPLYLQLYDYIKKDILSGALVPGEKLPSLRNLAKSLELSLTTIDLAYSQLTMEGYISSKPQSGYYINEIFYSIDPPQATEGVSIPPIKDSDYGDSLLDEEKNSEAQTFLYDLSCFDFNKWKKCFNKVLTEHSPLLLFESDPQGEPALRKEISKYLYGARGVICTSEQIVIGAGTQQITSHLAAILQSTGINHVAVEEPGYLPVKSIFRERGFLMTPVSVDKEGIAIDKLPSNIRSAVYVNPANQFPTGAVMPIAKRYELLDWAANNDSIIIEDDYDSELRYFGKPVPALQGLRQPENVVYLGSFSSTLFPSVKISYMVLPNPMIDIFQSIREEYTQTCSKTEQLTLSLFMQRGFYQTGIKKLRNLYSQKLQASISAFKEYGAGFVTPTNTSSGINMIVDIKSKKKPEQLCREAADLGIVAAPVDLYLEDKRKNRGRSLIIYYNRIPLEDISCVIEKLVCKWEG